MISRDSHGLCTCAVHAGPGPDPSTGAILTPIHQSTTFVQEAVGAHKGYTYTRSGNPTVAALERCLGEIEGVPPAACFSTGMAALTALFLSLLRGEDHVVVSDVVYGGTTRLLRSVLGPFGVRVDFADTSSPDTVRAAIKESTRLVLVETPANPTLKLTDISAVAEVAHAAGALVAVDNTLLTPALQEPFLLGADIAVYSTTKYIEGHNATVGGALLATDESVLEKFRFVQNAVGFPLSPVEAWITLRGVKTLPLRMERHSANALEVARFLERHPRVSRISHPGLESFPQHDTALKQQRAGGGMIAFEVEGGAEEAIRVMNSVRLASLAENLGAVETIVTHPASMTHSEMTAEERESVGISEGLIRLSVGLEDPEDIIEDLSRALRA